MRTLPRRRLKEIPDDSWVVAYCACPHHLSGVVVDSLRARGYLHAFVLGEGILEWERRGYPIVAALHASLPPLEPQQPAGVTR
jgi:cytochrome c oxidase cbb3-type subunit 3/ubiquinol-cytochrome c reductase cytochrome c subunit